MFAVVAARPPLRAAVGKAAVVVEATGRSGKVSLVAANGWCQVPYDDDECAGQTEPLQCPDLVREEAALAETIDAEVSDFDEVLIKWGFKARRPRPLRLFASTPTPSTRNCPHRRTRGSRRNEE